VLQQQCDLGYTSAWARREFGSVAERNDFFAQLGRTMQPDQETNLAGLTDTATPEEVLEQASA